MFTPGPYSANGTIVYSDAQPNHVAVCDTHDTAVLLAAAPDLLKQLINAVELLWNDAPQSAWDVIHKAKGE